jgi:hypothetical protein
MFKYATQDFEAETSYGTTDAKISASGGQYIFNEAAVLY